MNNLWSLLFLVMVTLQLFVGCNYTRFKNSDSDFRHTPGLTKTERDSLSYARVFNEVIDPYCLSCHRTGRFPLNDYGQTLALINKIRNAVFVIGSMPQGRSLPQKERSLLLAWLDNDAPEFGKAPEPELPPLQATYSSIRDRIFKTRCGDCHDPASPSCQDQIRPNESLSGHNKGACKLELSSFNELLHGDEETRKELVIPGSPDESQLIISIERTDGKDQMPPPELGYSPLTPDEIKVIRDWIAGGALNN